MTGFSMRNQKIGKKNFKQLNRIVIAFCGRLMDSVYFELFYGINKKNRNEDLETIYLEYKKLSEVLGREISIKEENKNIGLSNEQNSQKEGNKNRRLSNAQNSLKSDWKKINMQKMNNLKNNEKSDQDRNKSLDCFEKNGDSEASGEGEHGFESRKSEEKSEENKLIRQKEERDNLEIKKSEVIKRSKGDVIEVGESSKNKNDNFLDHESNEGKISYVIPENSPVFGIKNYRNNCYINSTLQCINATFGLKENVKLNVSSEKFNSSIRNKLLLSSEFYNFFSPHSQEDQTLYPKNLIKEISRK